MGNQFRHPTDDDYEPEPETPNPGFVRRQLARVQVKLGTLVSTVVTLLFMATVGLVAAANFTSCFQRADSVTGTSQLPRAMSAVDTNDARLYERLLSLWRSTGNSASLPRLWIIDDTAVNAASFGRGRFVAWQGLATLSDDDVDVIFAHEIAHDRLQHSRKSTELADVTNFFGDVIGTLSRSGERATRTLQKWTGEFVIPHYSRRQELEADSAAVGTLGARGYANPASTMCSTLLRLRSRVGEAGGGFFDSHPALTERIAALRTHFGALAAVGCTA